MVELYFNIGRIINELIEKYHFESSYDILGLSNYKNTEKAVTTYTFSYAELFLYLWELRYGGIPDTATEIAKLRRENDKLRFENDKMRRILLTPEITTNDLFFRYSNVIFRRFL